MSFDHKILPFLEILLDNAVCMYLTLTKNYFFKTERAAVKKEVSVLWPILKLRQKNLSLQNKTPKNVLRTLRHYLAKMTDLNTIIDYRSQITMTMML